MLEGVLIFLKMYFKAPNAGLSPEYQVEVERKYTKKMIDQHEREYFEKNV